MKGEVADVLTQFQFNSLEYLDLSTKLSVKGYNEIGEEGVRKIMGTDWPALKKNKVR